MQGRQWQTACLDWARLPGYETHCGSSEPDDEGEGTRTRSEMRATQTGARYTVSRPHIRQCSSDAVAARAGRNRTPARRLRIPFVQRLTLGGHRTTNESRSHASLVALRTAPRCSESPTRPIQRNTGGTHTLSRHKATEEGSIRRFDRTGWAVSDGDTVGAPGSKRRKRSPTQGSD